VWRTREYRLDVLYGVLQQEAGQSVDDLGYRDLQFLTETDGLVHVDRPRLQTTVVVHLADTTLLWSHHEETRELPVERDNARNNARCTQARKATHGLDGQHQDADKTPRQDSPWKSQSE